MTDKRALKILSDRYWSASGWRPDAQQVTSPEDLAYAKHAGVMFESENVSHDGVVERVHAAVRAVSPLQVANAFLGSLSSRHLERRSALGSYAVFRNIVPHFGPKRGCCPTCGADVEDTLDLNVLSFERHKWGGVRHDQPGYAAFDLEQFLRDPGTPATSGDIAIFRNLVAALRAAPPAATAASIDKLLAPAFPSNKAERGVVIAILGFCGILRTPEHPNYRNAFVPTEKRDLPTRRFVDMSYPACWWRGADGLEDEALSTYFGDVL